MKRYIITLTEAEWRNLRHALDEGGDAARNDGNDDLGDDCDQALEDVEGNVQED